jgi:ubiquinone/menaquinone biosynthesis C-methylase UbiE
MLCKKDRSMEDKVMKTKKREDRAASLIESQPAVPVRRTIAQDLFDGIASSYDTWAQVLTFFQYLRWRRFLVSRMAFRPGNLVLDVCTGTAGVAIEIAGYHNCRIVGLDVSHLMLEAGLRAVEKQSLDGRV